MDSKRLIKPQSDLVERCWEWARHVVSRGLHPASLALSVRGAEHNVALWAEAKLAECIFAIAYDLNPREDVHWSGDAELDGIDLIVDGVTVDVKQTQPTHKLLIWSRGKVGKLELKTGLDTLALVKCSMKDGGGLPDGWITRTGFLKERKIITADDRPYNLDIGTQYMHRDDLWPAFTFPHGARELLGLPPLAPALVPMTMPPQPPYDLINDDGDWQVWRRDGQVMAAGLPSWDKAKALTRTLTETVPWPPQ